MAVAYWPPSMPFKPLAGTYSEQRQDALARFQPDLGVDITRPRTTAVVALVSYTTLPVTRAVGDEFLAWYDETLRQGSVEFAWREPRSNRLYMWKFTAPPEVADTGGVKDRFTVSLIRLPSVPWFAPYVPEGRAVVPSFVADYENAVYGIDGVLKTAADMPSVSGIAEVHYTIGNTSVSQIEVVSTGDIPSTAPSNTLITRTNLLTYSEDASNADWNALGLTIVEKTGEIAAPASGPERVWEFSETSATGSHQFSQTNLSLISGITYHAAIYAKAGRHNKVALFLRDEASGVVTITSARFDLSAGTVVAGVGTILALGDGWFRCAISAAAPSNTAAARLLGRISDNAGAFIGDPLKSVLIGGWQLNSGTLEPYQRVDGATTFDTYDRIVGFTA